MKYTIGNGISEASFRNIVDSFKSLGLGISNLVISDKVKSFVSLNEQFIFTNDYSSINNKWIVEAKNIKDPVSGNFEEFKSQKELKSAIEKVYGKDISINTVGQKSYYEAGDKTVGSWCSKSKKGHMFYQTVDANIDEGSEPAPEVIISRYLRSHGKSPSGRGLWMFGLDQSDSRDYNNKKKFFTFNDTYSNAKKAAINYAKEIGAKQIYVMEGVTSFSTSIIEEVSKSDSGFNIKLIQDGVEKINTRALNEEDAAKLVKQFTSKLIYSSAVTYDDIVKTIPKPPAIEAQKQDYEELLNAIKDRITKYKEKYGLTAASVMDPFTAASQAIKNVVESKMSDLHYNIAVVLDPIVKGVNDKMIDPDSAGMLYQKAVQKLIRQNYSDASQDTKNFIMKQADEYFGEALDGDLEEMSDESMRKYRERAALDAAEKLKKGDIEGADKRGLGIYHSVKRELKRKVTNINEVTFEISYDKKSSTSTLSGKTKYQAPDEATARKRFMDDNKPTPGATPSTVTIKSVVKLNESFDTSGLETTLNKISKDVDEEDQNFIQLAAQELKGGNLTKAANLLKKADQSTLEKLAGMMNSKQKKSFETLLN